MVKGRAIRRGMGCSVEIAPWYQFTNAKLEFRFRALVAEGGAKRLEMTRA